MHTYCRLPLLSIHFKIFSMKFFISILISFLIFCTSAFSQTYEANWASLDKRPLPQWFEDAKFGIFIHWGVYSVPAYSPTASDSVDVYERYAEHYWRRLNEKNANQHFFIDFHQRVYGNKSYRSLSNDFRAEMFSADDWAKLFKDAGAKYVVLTSKHHEGFTLWPSKFSPGWNALQVGAKKDLLGELTSAVRHQGLKMGYYYSLLEWDNPLYKPATITQYVTTHMLPQMKELVTMYKPDIVWPDGEWDYTSDVLKSEEFLAWLYNQSPVKNTVVVNDRWGKETRSKHGGFYTTEYDLVGSENSKDKAFKHPWEECRGIGGSFGYNRKENLADYSSSKELVDILIDKVARGGNLLLNIGPTADGRIPVIMQQRLSDLGNWLKINGDAIYGTRKWEAAPDSKHLPNSYFTQKGNDLFLIVNKWSNNAITLHLPNKPGEITMLGFDGKIEQSFNEGNITITPPVLSPTTNPSDYAWVYKIPNALKK